jgi:soluble lytic murein transglycosylase-like protein
MKEQDRYDSLIRYYAEQNNLDWLQIKAQIRAESAFDPSAVSRVGAKGLGQFMPATWKEWSANVGPGADPCNPEYNIIAMCAYMRWLLKQFNQDLRHALAAYNWGIGNMKKLLASKTDGIPWVSGLPDETKKYLIRINGYYTEYLKEA